MIRIIIWSIALAIVFGAAVAAKSAHIDVDEVREAAAVGALIGALIGGLIAWRESRKRGKK